MILPLKQGILYGPVDSRRYGKSLGINLMPVKDKLCSFNCVYCHYGATVRTTLDMGPYQAELPGVEDVAAVLEETLQSSLELDLITFSGNGEPTLHPQFARMVNMVVELRAKYRPNAKVALLSNSTGLMIDGVREAMGKIDLPVLKLDAGNKKTFRAINRPANGISFDDIVEQLSSLSDIYIQTVLIGGKPSNTTESELSDYIEAINGICPREIHIYSIDRPVPNSRISLVPPERLREIANRIELETGIRVRPFYK